MITIGLCEDHPVFIQAFLDEMQLLEQTYQIAIKTQVFETASSLLTHYRTDPHLLDLLFLDIIMDEQNGIETAKQIRNLNSQQPLIFLTSSKEFAYESYEVQAQGYVLKNQMKSGLEIYIKEFIETSHQNKRNTMLVKNNHDLIRLDLDQVLFFESNLRKITATLSNGKQVIFYNKLSQLESELPQTHFVRIHRSFVVNLFYLQNIVGLDAILKNQTTLPISKKYLVASKASFLDFMQHTRNS
ncbi:MAG: LytR/AlgR family response regulator transcription factor [Erysipelotrichaceae bacterium]